MRKKIISILLWSVISAAFIGPGTLATATAAGSGFGLSLSWALGFAAFACLILQEMVARITISTGKGLVELLQDYFETKLWPLVIGLSVILGCMAYQAGNILGAVSGLALTFSIDKWILTSAVGAICILLLAIGSTHTISKILGLVVASMGLLFLYMAIASPIDQLIAFPRERNDSSLIILGLVGTTIVPYNLFLGAGLAKKESISSMRFGLTISVLFGGLISLAVLVVAANLTSSGDFAEIAVFLKGQLGDWAFYFMGYGLFAAGITSSLTSPMAAAIISKEIFNKKNAYGVTWLVVISFGLIFGLMDIKPLPVIIAAQALNVFVLPSVAMMVILLVNDSRYIKKEHLNNEFQNILALCVLDLVLMLALHGLLKLTKLYMIETMLDFFVIQMLLLPILVLVYKKTKSNRLS